MSKNDILFDNTNVAKNNNIIFTNDETTTEVINSQYDIIFTTPYDRLDNNLFFNGAENLPDLPSIELITGLLNVAYLPPSILAVGSSKTPPIKGVITLHRYSVVIALGGYYNVNNPFEWLLKKGQSLQEADKVVIKKRQRFRNSLSSEKKTTTKFEKSECISSKLYTKMEGGVSLGTKLVTDFEKAKPIQILNYTSTFESSVVIALSKSQSLQKAETLSPIIYRTSLQIGQLTYTSSNTSYQKSVPVERGLKSFFNLSSIIIHNFVGKFEKAEELGNPKPVIAVTPPTPTADKSNDILFQCLAKEWEKNPHNYTIVFNDTCELEFNQYTDFSEPIFVKNTFTLKNLETGQEIKANDLNFSTDVDSYAWTGSMTIPDNQVEFLKSPTNKAVLIEYIFNDIKAVFQVGKVSRNITFGQRSYKVKLSSPTIKFDEPVSGVNSYTNQDTLTPNAYAEQLLDQTNNGIGLVWDFLSPLEWVINKGAFTYQNLPPIKAIGAMLENSGAFISSSLDGKNLVVKRKRPLVFWEAVDSSKIINIPSGVITSLGYEVEHLQHFNGVYVLADDRTVFVKRKDTNGATLAPQVVAKQLTSDQSCVEVGRYTLANAGIIETHDLVKPILNDRVVLNPADIVKFTLDGTTYIGTVVSTSVAIKFNSQYQTFKVEVVKGFN